MALTSVEGTCCITKSEDLVASVLANLPTVQALLGAADDDEAKAGIMFFHSIDRKFDVTAWLIDSSNRSTLVSGHCYSGHHVE